MGRTANVDVTGAARLYRAASVWTAGVGLSVFEQLIKREVNVLGDLTEQDRRDVSRLMKRYGGAATGSIAKLFMRATLADFREAESEKNGNDSVGLRTGTLPIGQATATF